MSIGKPLGRTVELYFAPWTVSRETSVARSSDPVGTSPGVTWPWMSGGPGFAPSPPGGFGDPEPWCVPPAGEPLFDVPVVEPFEPPVEEPFAPLVDEPFAPLVERFEPPVEEVEPW